MWSCADLGSLGRGFGARAPELCACFLCLGGKNPRDHKSTWTCPARAATPTKCVGQGVFLWQRELAPIFAVVNPCAGRGSFERSSAGRDMDLASAAGCAD